jgi:hypothetical protein
MKPLVIYDLERHYSDDNKIIITKERFEQILEEVYGAGAEDASNNKYSLQYSPGIIKPINPVEVTYNQDVAQTAAYNANKAANDANKASSY